MLSCALLLSISSRLCFLCFYFVNIIPLAYSYCNILLLSCVYKHKINILSISSRLRILIASSKQHPTIWQQRALKRAHCKKAKLSKKTYFDYSCPLYSNILSPVFKYIVPCIQIYDAVQWVPMTLLSYLQYNKGQSVTLNDNLAKLTYLTSVILNTTYT